MQENWLSLDFPPIISGDKSLALPMKSKHSVEKISVKGSDAHPLYKYLSDKELNGTCDKAPSWNFCKYLIDEKGQVVKFFGSAVDPLSSEITELL